MNDKETVRAIIEPFNLAVSYGRLKGPIVGVNHSYTVFVGPNDVGKSSILQYFFANVLTKDDASRSSVCFIEPHRQHVNKFAPANTTLAQYNVDLSKQLKDRPKEYSNRGIGPNYEQLFQILLHSSDDMVSVLEGINSLLIRMGFQEITIGQQQALASNNAGVGFHGSGFRAILPILAAIVSPIVKIILIDEPEISLEPRAQKALKNILLETSSDKTIIIATQSHLFINKDEIEANIRAFEENEDKVPEFTRLESQADLVDLIYNMLGGALSDLMLPESFIVVEGSSDSTIVQSAAKVLGYGIDKVKVFSARGGDNTRNALESIENTLSVIGATKSPYCSRTVILLDKPNEQEKNRANLIKQKIGEDRYFELPQCSIEEYMEKDIYKKAGRIKENDINEINDKKRQINNASKKADKVKLEQELSILKGNIASDISKILSIDEIDKMPLIRDSILKVIELSTEV